MKNQKVYPRLPALVKSKVGSKRFSPRLVESSVNGVAKRFKGTKTKGVFSLDICDKKSGAYSIKLDGRTTKVSKTNNEKADLHICCTEANWAEIVSGRLSPADAYIQGKISVSGKMDFIKRLYSLATKESDLEDFII